MKKLQAWILSLAILFALAVPAAAGEVRNLPVIGALLAAAEEQSYWDGYEASYDVSYEEGYAAGQSGASQECDNPYEFLDDFAVDSYADGYQNGQFEGYDSGWYSGWRTTQPWCVGYDTGREEGYAQGLPTGKSWYPDEAKLDSLEWPEAPGLTDEVDLTDGEGGHALGYQVGYAYGCYDGYWEAEAQEADRLAQRSREDELTALGGVPGQINVMVDGTCLSFADATPQMRHNRAMIPLRGALEALGAQVNYTAGGKITMDWNGVKMETAVGQAIVSVTRDGDTSPITMDCASYVEGDRVYVPLRFLGQAAGYDVLWDEDYQTAVLLDPAALTAALNEDFTILNRLMAQQMPPAGESFRTTGDLTMKAEIIDTIDGNQTAVCTGQTVSHVQGMTLDMTGNCDLSQFWELLENSAPILGISPETLTQWKTAYSQITLAMKVDETGAVYLQCPALNQTMLPDLVKAVAPDVWLLVTRLEPESLAGQINMGALLYAGTVSPNAYDPIHVYARLLQARDGIKQLIGDNTFTKSGNSYQWSFGLAELAQLLELNDQDRGEMEGILRQFSMQLTFRTDGRYESQGEIKVGVPGLGALLRSAFQGSGSAAGGTGSGTLQIRNLLNLTGTAKTTRETTSQPPDTSLPQGARVIDLTGGRLAGQ